MFDSFTDIVKTATLAFAVLLPFLIGWMQFMRDDRRHRAAMEKPTVGNPAMAAIGGLLLSENNIERIMETAHEHAKSVNRLARSIEQDREVTKRIADRLCDELTAMRRSNEALTEAMLKAVRARR